MKSKLQKKYFSNGNEDEMGFGVDEDSIGEANEKPDVMNYFARKLKRFLSDHD